LDKKPKDQTNTQILKPEEADVYLQAYNIEIDENLEGTTVSKMQSYKSSKAYCPSGKKNIEINTKNQLNN